LLFRRRAVLARATREDSALRRWFWAGRITRILQVFVALMWAALLLAFAALLKPEHWLVLGIDVVLLALLVGVVRGRMAGQVKQRQLGLLARGWPLLLINLLLLSLGFMVVDFFVIGVADTRGMSWYQVAEQAMTGVAVGAQCPLAGMGVGLLAALQQLSGHLSQMVIPSLPDRQLKLAAWGLLLLQAGVFAYAFSRLQLGVVGLLDARKLRLSTLSGDSSFSKAFVLTILVLALPYLYAAYKLQGFDPGSLQTGARQVLDWANPCKPDPQAMVALEQGLLTEVGNAREQSRQQASEQVDVSLDDLFGDVEQGVDRYLDWYFTIIGEYQRLAAVATGDLGKMMGDQLEEHLFADNDFSGRLSAIDQRIGDASRQRMVALREQLGERSSGDQQANPCALGGLDLSAFGDLQRDGVRASVAAGGGTLAAVTTSKLLAKKTAAAVVGKVAVKKSFATATALIGKMAAKKGGSVLLSAAGGAALCAPGGPLAAVCGVAAGVAAWLAFDKVFLEIDEALFRDEMRADILAVLGEQRLELAAAMKQQQHAAIDAMASELQQATDGLFIPARDGL